MDYIDEYKEYVAAERRFIESVPCDATNAQLISAQFALDEMRARRSTEDRLASVRFYREAKKTIARAKLKGLIGY